jgi:hypothetical protein
MDGDAVAASPKEDAKDSRESGGGGGVEGSEESESMQARGSESARRSSSTVKSLFLRLSEPLDWAGEKIHSAVSGVLNSSAFTKTIDPIAERTPDLGMPFRAVGKAAAPMVDSATDTVVTLTTDASRIIVSNTEKMTDRIPGTFNTAYDKFETHVENRKNASQPLISTNGEGEADYRNMTELDANDTGKDSGGAVEKVSADKDAVPFQTTNSKITIEEQEEVVDVQKSDITHSQKDDETPPQQGGKKNKRNKHKGKGKGGDDKEEE